MVPLSLFMKCSLRSRRRVFYAHMLPVTILQSRSSLSISSELPTFSATCFCVLGKGSGDIES